jgi:8-oxo-dGTP diphosphatase/2-hydroxy-dATP diphosphatase
MGCHVDIETPPGLKYMNLTYFASGGDENSWLPFTKVKYYTNAFVVKDDKVCFLLLDLSLN